MTSPYRDLDRPPLREADLRRALVASSGGADPGLWRDVRVVAETGSTNADLVAAARAGEPAGLVLVAERQTAGRGRLDRDWEAPARAGLTFSVLLRPREVPPADRGWLPLLTGLAVAEAVTELDPDLPVALKWPNDLLAGAHERKLGGILVELVADAAVVGIGINVSTAESELPVPTATSLALEGGRTDRDPLLRSVLRRLAGRYRDWAAAGGDADACGLRAAYVARCATLGRAVRIKRPARPDLVGVAGDIDRSGQLVVRTEAATENVGAGDVIHVR